MSQLKKIYLEGEKKVPLNKKSDIQLIMSFDFFNYSAQPELLFNAKAQDYKRFFGKFYC